MKVERKKALQKLCVTLGFNIGDLKLLNVALTHSSYAHEKKDFSMDDYNERIEFLGDSVLGLIVSTFLYKKFPNLNEGEMTKVRARYVCEQALAGYARKIRLGEYLLLGKGEETSGGRERNSILADAFESVIGAFYLDSGFIVTEQLVQKIVAEELLKHEQKKIFLDYKTQLQEVVQRNTEHSIKYVVVAETGPDHNKKYQITVNINDLVMGEGTGKNKKEAEQLAAKMALAALEDN